MALALELAEVPRKGGVSGGSKPAVFLGDVWARLFFVLFGFGLVPGFGLGVRAPGFGLGVQVPDFGLMRAPGFGLFVRAPLFGLAAPVLFFSPLLVVAMELSFSLRILALSGRLGESLEAFPVLTAFAEVVLAAAASVDALSSVAVGLGSFRLSGGFLSKEKALLKLAFSLMGEDSLLGLVFGVAALPGKSVLLSWGRFLVGEAALLGVALAGFLEVFALLA